MTRTVQLSPDTEAPPIPDRRSDLDAFIADVTARYDVTGIYLFGSRGGGGREPSSTSDWDILVFTDRGAAGDLVDDKTLQRHFGEFLDLFAMPSPGCWYYPDWTTCEGGDRGWFPESHPEIEESLQCVWESSE